MGIRLDQLHNEVFAKIASDIAARETAVIDYLDNRVAEIDIVFGLPETTHVERDVEVNKRNLEKSGFIEINRHFVPFKTGTQAEAGVWISNLNTNESPFEPKTIDGQKRGISVGGHILNYTAGNIAQSIDKMLKLPIAPNLPAFFPEDNDMVMTFNPSKLVTQNRIVLDTAVEITITKRITDGSKKEIDKVLVNNTIQYYYMDEDSIVYFLNSAGRSYIQGIPGTLLVETYQRFTESFGGTFPFTKIYDADASRRFVDTTTGKLFEIKTPLADRKEQVQLKSSNKQVYLENVTVTRYEEVDGVLEEKTITQPMLVTYTINNVSVRGIATQSLSRLVVSEVGFPKTTGPLVDGGAEYTYITDKGIKMFVAPASIYYYYPFSTYELDDETGDKLTLTTEQADLFFNMGTMNDPDTGLPIIDSETGLPKIFRLTYKTDEEIEALVAADATLMHHKLGDVDNPTFYKLIIDTDYKTYTPLGNNKPGDTVVVIDNITGKSVKRTVETIAAETISYYKVDTVVDGSTSLTIVTLDDNGLKINAAHQPNADRPVKITATNTLTTSTGGNTVTLSAGKEFFYHPTVGTKYYKMLNGTIYYVDTLGNLYKPAQDVQSIFSGTINNVDTEVVTQQMFYGANGLLFFMDEENLRTYVQGETKQQLQLTDENGYRVFEKADKTKVYVVDSTRMVTITPSTEEGEDPIETVVNVPYGQLTPLFEMELVTEYILNLVHPIAFNIVQGNIALTRNGTALAKYSDYNVTANLRLLKDLEYNEERNIAGDTLYIKREGKKDIILRMEKTGTAGAGDIKGHWANNTGVIVMPEPMTGNSFQWSEGQLLPSNRQLDYGDVVKGDNNRYYKYTGPSLSYAEMGTDKAIRITRGSVFWEDVTVAELEWERRGYNYEFFNIRANDIIRFTVTRRVWQQHAVTGEMVIVQQKPYSIERTALQNGHNLMILEDGMFMFEENPIIASYILVIENIKPYSTYTKNRANNFLLTLTGLQTVTKNEDAAMVYSDDYFISKCTLYITTASMSDEMVLRRIQAPQAELQINFNTTSASQQVTVPFEIIKNKFDIVVPEKIVGHEYTWFMGDNLPEGKVLATNDVVFDKVAVKFYKYLGATKATPRQSLLRQSEDVQKELLRQIYKIGQNNNPGEYWDDLNLVWVKEAKKISDADGIVLELSAAYEAGKIQDSYFIVTAGKSALNTANSKVVDYLNLAKKQMIETAEYNLNDAAVDAFVETAILTAAVKTNIKAVLNTNLNQFVLKTVRLDEDGEPVLDEDANKVYDYSYTRAFMVETRYNPTTKKNEFITRNISGVETVVTGVWQDITAPKVGYYRFGKTFTILNTKETDQIFVRLLDTGAEVFTSSSFISKGGPLTFSIDFNIEEYTGVEIPFEVIHHKIKWAEGIDYLQEGQKVTLSMVGVAGQNVIIRRNDVFDMIDIVVLERKDLVFVEVWHEDVSETGFIFPFGNVQYQGNTADGITTEVFDHKFYDTLSGERAEIPDSAKSYCQAYEKGSVVYNYYAGTSFDPATVAEKKFIDSTFVADPTVGKGWKLANLSDGDRAIIFKNADHNLYYDGEALIQIRYRTRVAGINLFRNYFKGTSEYMSEGLRFQGKSPVTSRIVTRKIGEYTTADGRDKAGQPITETIQQFAGEQLIIASSQNSLLYKQGKLYDDALFTVENPTPLSHNGYVHAIPVAIVNRRNQGVYHPEYNPNGTGFFINGIHVSEDKEDFADDITGFTLVDEHGATLQTSSVGRDRKAKFKVMLNWLFSIDYKAGGSMVSRTTYRPDSLLYDEINTRDIIDLRIDANDQRKRIEDLESGLKATDKTLSDLSVDTKLRFEQTTNYINTTANLLYSHIATTESAIRKDMNAKDASLTAGLEETNTHLADLSANTFTKKVTTNLLIDTLDGMVADMDTDAFNTWATSGAGDGLKDKNGIQLLKPNRDYIEGMINAFVENMEGPYTRVEFMKFLVTVLKLVTDKTMLREDELDRWIRRLSVKNLVVTEDKTVYSRAEALELIYEGLILASASRVLPPTTSSNSVNWEWQGKRFNGWLGSKNLELVKDFLENGRVPVAQKKVKASTMTKTFDDIEGKTWNSGFIAGPTVWGDVHNYHAIYTTFIFVTAPFIIEDAKMSGDDSHAIFINKELVARNKYCCRDSAYTYEFAVPGWYRIDAMYSEATGGHYMQLGWNPLDYKDKIKYMTTVDMDAAVEITKLRLDNWASKLKTLTSTIKGDATGYFTKLETKIILIEGLTRIRTHILTKGPTVTDSDLKAFHTGNVTTPGLESWIDNVNSDGKFSSLGYTIQPGTDASGNEYPREDLFRPVPNDLGKFNKDEVLEIVRKGLQLVNGIDAISASDIDKWVNRLEISIPMSNTRYYTITQVDALLKAGNNYLTGLDKVTSFEISKWLDNLIKQKNMIFFDQDTSVYSTGNDLSEAADTNAYTKVNLKTLLKTKLKALLGAQAAKKIV